MPEIKLQHILTLIELLSQGAHHNFVEVTTTLLGKGIGRSQQAASKHLLDLETSGYIERLKKGQKYAVKVTDKGYSEIQSLYLSLRAALESAPRQWISRAMSFRAWGRGHTTCHWRAIGDNSEKN